MPRSGRRAVGDYGGAMVTGKYAILAFVLIVLCPLPPSLGAEGDKIPPIVLPAALAPYSDEGKVTAATIGVLGLLGTAKFVEPAADSMWDKPPCNAPDILSFYRGMTLMQAGYFIFINKVERGFESVDSPHVTLAQDFALVETTFGSLVKPGRELLIGFWDTNMLARVVSLISAVRSNPPSVNGDLASYFRVLLEFADRYESVKRRAPKELGRLNHRRTSLYRYERNEKLEEAKRRGASELSDAKARYPEHIFYEAYAKEMRLLLDANRDLGQTTISECFDGGDFAAVHFGSNKELTYEPYGLYPASYMAGFWQRRDHEGTTRLARFVIGRLLWELKR